MQRYHFSYKHKLANVVEHVMLLATSRDDAKAAFQTHADREAAAYRFASGDDVVEIISVHEMIDVTEELYGKSQA